MVLVVLVEDGVVLEAVEVVVERVVVGRALVVRVVEGIDGVVVGVVTRIVDVEDGTAVVDVVVDT